MQLSLATVDITHSDLLEDYVRRALQAALGAHFNDVVSARVRLVDVNGPERGGLDKRCWLTLRLTEGSDIVAESIHADAKEAFGLTAVEAASLLARRKRAQRRQRAASAMLLASLCLMVLSACAGRSAYPLLTNAEHNQTLTITEAERLAQILERESGFVPEVDPAVLHLTVSSRPADLEAYRLLAAAESHLMTAKLVDAMAASIHEHAARASLRSLYEAANDERRGFSRLAAVSGRLKIASHQLRAQAEVERKQGLDLSRATTLQTATTTLELALIIERSIATKNWQSFDSAMASLMRAGSSNDALIKFYRAIDAFERRGDVATAQRHLDEAMSQSPAFSRAHSALVLLHPNVANALFELAVLARTQPNHRWAKLVVAEN